MELRYALDARAGVGALGTQMSLLAPGESRAHQAYLPVGKVPSQAEMRAEARLGRCACVLSLVLGHAREAEAGALLLLLLVDRRRALALLRRERRVVDGEHVLRDSS